MFIYLKIYINPSTFFIICRAQQAKVCNFVHQWLGNPPCLESAVEGSRSRQDHRRSATSRGGADLEAEGRRRAEVSEPRHATTPTAESARGGRGPPGSDSRMDSKEVTGRRSGRPSPPCATRRHRSNIASVSS